MSGSNPSSVSAQTSQNLEREGGGERGREEGREGLRDYSVLLKPQDDDICVSESLHNTAQ